MIEIKRKRGPRAKISMAPLIDCIFLLLIFFLLTSTFARQRAFELELPSAQSSEVSDEQMIEITCRQSGELFIDNEPVARQNLRAELSGMLTKSETKDVLLIADRRVMLGDLTELIDRIKQAGGSSLSIATRGEGDG
jgi:biopolymer transport protein ExbD